MSLSVKHSAYAVKSVGRKKKVDWEVFSAWFYVGRHLENITGTRYSKLQQPELADGIKMKTKKSDDMTNC